MKKLLILVLTLVGIVSLAACGKKDDKPAKTTPSVTTPDATTPDATTPDVEPAGDELVIWVGSESATFYQGVMSEYVKQYKNEHGVDFPGKISVKGVDTGSAAALFLADTEAGPDIFTIAHDNFGKLLDGEGAIGSIDDEALIEQMEENNSNAFLNACYLSAGDGSAAQYYGVPIISQALVLYYNKSAFEGQEDKLATWEGILEVAQAKNSLATSFMGTDGYNYSAFLLAQPKSDDAVAAFGKQGTLQIYQNGIQEKCYNWGDDQVAIWKWAQDFICNPNGRNGVLTSNDGWETELQNGDALTLIGGAWSKGGVIASLKADNWGVTQLPSFTLTADHAYGQATAGMEFWTGTFADCKCLVKNKNSKYAAYLDDILLYLSSNEVQEMSFIECDNLPASKNASVETDDELQTALAAAQVASGAHGIAQPFGFKTKYNSYYYSAGAPDLYIALSQNSDSAYTTDAQIVEVLQQASYIWRYGKARDLVNELDKWNSWIQGPAA